MHSPANTPTKSPVDTGLGLEYLSGTPIPATTGTVVFIAARTPGYNAPRLHGTRIPLR